MALYIPVVVKVVAQVRCIDQYNTEIQHYHLAIKPQPIHMRILFG